MSSFKLSFLYPFFFILAVPAAGQSLYYICDTRSIYTDNSIYEFNLNQLLSALAANGSAAGFLIDTVGQVPNRVYGLALCRGDANASLCNSCLAGGHKDVLQACAYNKGATIWYDRCLLSFSYQRSLLTSTDAGQAVTMWNVKSVTDFGRLNATVVELLSKIASWAAFNTTKMFATGEVHFTAELPTMYGLVQCTTDLTASQCRQCLQRLFDPLPKEMVGKQGGRVIAVKCNFRYELYSFYDGPPTLRLATPHVPAPPPPPPRKSATAPPPLRVLPASQEQGKMGNSTGTVLAIAVPIVVAVLLITLICFCFLKRNLAKKYPYEKNQEDITSIESLLFELNTL